MDRAVVCRAVVCLPARRRGRSAVTLQLGHKFKRARVSTGGEGFGRHRRARAKRCSSAWNCLKRQNQAAPRRLGGQRRQRAVVCQRGRRVASNQSSAIVQVGTFCAAFLGSTACFDTVYTTCKPPYRPGSTRSDPPGADQTSISSSIWDAVRNSGTVRNLGFQSKTGNRNFGRLDENVCTYTHLLRPESF